MKRVFIITYFFPPLGMAGVQRTLKFIKYLPSCGWEPTVLTVKDVDYFARDQTLLDEVADSVEVIRTESVEPFRLTRLFLPRRPGVVSQAQFFMRRGLFRYLNQFLFLPDSKVGWIPAALGPARQLFLERHFDLIYSTAPPYSAHILASLLKLHTGLPLVIDFRDSWSDNPFASYPTPAHSTLVRYLERRTLRRADAVIAVDRAIAGLLARRLRQKERSKVRVVEQGYDPEDFAVMSAPRDRRFTIVYTGTFIGDRTSRYLLTALAHLIAQGRIPRDDICVRFVGARAKSEEAVASRFGLGQVVEFIPYVPHRESVAHLVSADLLWLIIGPDEGETIATGKIYEYLGARRPILASVPRGVAQQLVESTGAGIAVHPQDERGLERVLLQFYRNFKQDGALPEVPAEAVERFDRRRLTGKLAAIFDETLGSEHTADGGAGRQWGADEGEPPGAAGGRQRVCGPAG